MTASSDILFERRGVAGVVTLNRPQALNAINHGMVHALAERLAAWADDPAVKRVVITAAGDRAFSAGGDIRVLTELGRRGQHEAALQFWREEYALNATIKRYAKPYVALIDGIVMGGGVGVSIHGSHRVAGDRFRFAMPEVGIGFFPDVGATWFLPRMPGETGTYCALTGERLQAADALATGLVSHVVPSARWPELVSELASDRPVDAILDGLAVVASGGHLADLRGAIDRLFAGDSVEEILERLDREGSSGTTAAAFAATTAAAIRTKSPLSLKIALAQLRRGRHWSFEDCMRAEFRIVSRIIYSHDFYEGVRAAIVDKDQAPHWRPAALSEVKDQEVERHFEPVQRELALS